MVTQATVSVRMSVAVMANDACVDRSCAAIRFKRFWQVICVIRYFQIIIASLTATPT